jgi:hypothetical protein
MCSPGRAETCSAVSARIAFSNGLPSFRQAGICGSFDGIIVQFALRYLARQFLWPFPQRVRSVPDLMHCVPANDEASYFRFTTMPS